MFRWLNSMLSNPLSTNKRTYSARIKTADFEQCILLQLAKRMFLERAMVQKKTRKPLILEKIINLLFVALKGSLPSQWGVWGLQNDEGKCWQNITSGFLCQEKQLNLKSVLYFRANFPVCPPCWPAENI